MIQKKQHNIPFIPALYFFSKIIRMKQCIKILLLCVILLSSCGTYEKTVYLQDANKETVTKIVDYSGISIQPQDKLAIIVYSKTLELALPFNLTTISYLFVNEKPLSINQQNISGYIVDKDGEIDFSILGKLKVAGLTREELVLFIKNKLVSENYISDPIVTVQFLNFRIFIGGEVANPGMYEITNDRITLLEAITMAGDLTIYGKRDNVKIIREKNGERKIYVVDLRKAELFNSPAYYLQQNDYIYVEPNNQKIKDARRR
jgi:polysaccharide export outer membrane protein